MSTFTKEYDGIADAIITNSIVLPAVEMKEGDSFPPYYYTDNAAWDTGAQFTFISHRVVEALALSPYREGEIMGIGGDQTAKTYKVHIGLPNGSLIHDVEVYCSDIDDYDILIGMDIISLTDFCITNKDNKTRFEFRTPSIGGINL